MRAGQTIRCGIQAICTTAFAASMMGVTVITSIFTIGGTAFYIGEVASDRVRPLELFGPLMGAPIIFLLTFFASFVFTIPISSAGVMFIYPLVRAFNMATRNVLAFIGADLGTVAWLYIFPARTHSAPFEGPLAAILIGGLAGVAGGVMFSRFISNGSEECGAAQTN